MTMRNINATLAIAMMQVGRFRSTSAFSSSPKPNRTFASIENLGEENRQGIGLGFKLRTGA